MIVRPIFVMFLLCLASTGNAQELLKLRPSPLAIASARYQDHYVKITYSQPQKKNREIFGGLVPYGSVWRTGANEATEITTIKDIQFDAILLKAGTYSIFTIPEKDKWTLIITKQLDVTNPSAYKKESDVARVEAKAVTTNMVTETFTMQFTDVKNTSLALNISWDKTAVSLPISTDIDSKVMAQIDAAMKSDNAQKPYFPAAMYYMETGKDLNQALTWLDKAAELDANAFWVWHQRANVLAKLGKKQEAISSANKSIELAKQAKNADYVALNEKLLATLK